MQFFGRLIFSGAEILFDSSEMCGLMLFPQHLQESGRLQTEGGLIQNIWWRVFMIATSSTVPLFRLGTLNQPCLSGVFIDNQNLEDKIIEI